MRQCFIAVATGQPVANLPPILEQMHSGDAVVWVESASAREKRWAEGASEVLRRHGMEVLPSLTVRDDPSDIVAAVRGSVERWGNMRVLLVGNGGTKLTALALQQAFASTQPTLLYNSDRRAELWCFPRGIDSPVVRSVYEKGQLTLADILRCTQHHISNPDQAECFWPAVNPPAAADPAYGNDPAYTALRHQRFVQSGEDKAIPQGDLSPFEKYESLAPDHARYWLAQGVLPFLNSSRNVRLPRSKAHFPEQLLPQARNLYNATVNHARKGARLLRTATGTAESGRAAGFPSSLGDAFEDAVALRLYRWLQQQPQAPRYIHSTWRRVKVHHASRPGNQVAEWDIVLVLRNGILLCVECKSFDMKDKDLDARLLSLHESGSRLARMAICSPMYTGFSDREWFAVQHHVRQRVRFMPMFVHLPFTLVGQPRRYIWQPPESLPLTVEVETVEEALTNWAGAYCPIPS